MVMTIPSTSTSSFAIVENSTITCRRSKCFVTRISVISLYLFQEMIQQVTPVHASNNAREVEELQQLQVNLALATTQCAQLEEANRAWQQFHQNQLELFRDKLHEHIVVDTNDSLEQIAQQILAQLNQSRRERPSTLHTDNQSGEQLTAIKCSRNIPVPLRDCYFQICV